MKGTIMKIVGQESGFILYPLASKEGTILYNWASDTEEYTCDPKSVQYIDSCLLWLIDRGAIKILDNKVVKQYVEYADPVNLEDLDVPGRLYDLGEFEVLAPEGWN